MIADWSVEIGPDSPSIDIPWSGWVDLRRRWHQCSAPDLAELRAFPELIDLLKLLNDGNLFTSKVDVFPITRDEVDPEIAEHGMEATSYGLGSYLDVVLEDRGVLAGFEDYEALVRNLVRTLASYSPAEPCTDDRTGTPAPSLVEVVLRPASVFGAETFGFTLYAAGFGSTRHDARRVWLAAALALAKGLARDVAAIAASRLSAQALPGGAG